MDFDFPEQFRNYTVTQLLEIVRNPEQYRPEAVEAAGELLRKKEISQQENADAEDFFSRKEEATAQRKEKVNRLLQPVVELIEPFLKPGEYSKPVIWLRVVLCLLVFQMVRQCWGITSRLIRYLQKPHLTSDIFLEIYFFLELILLLVLFILLYRKQRWGWILFFVFCMFNLGGQALILWKRLTMTSIVFLPIDPTTVFMHVLIYSGLAVFLWRSQVAAMFNIDQPTKKITLIVALAAALIFPLLTIL